MVVSQTRASRQPDWQFSAHAVSEEQLDAYRQHFPGTTLSASGNTVRVPRGNLCEAGLLASAGVALWLTAQSFLLLPLSLKFFGVMDKMVDEKEESMANGQNGG